MKNYNRYIERNISPRVTRRDYTKIDTNFELPNLIDIQIKSFQRFLDSELTDVVKSYFPISSPNGKYSLEFDRLWFDKEKRTEEKSRYEGKNYELPVYLDLFIVNNETGEKKKARKSSKTKSDGIFLCNIPLMTKKGTFVINGIEKVVIAQIIRSTGVFLFPKGQMKLNNSRKKILKGLICEFLPIRGTHLMFQIPENKDYIVVNAKDTTGETVKTIPATVLLKALGLSNSFIEKTFENNNYVMNTLRSDGFAREDILNNPEVTTIISSINNPSERSVESDTSIDSHLKKMVLEYMNLDEKDDPSLDEQKNLLLDKIIVEKTAKTIVHELSISTKAVEMEAIYSRKSVTYQTLVWNHFFTQRKYDISDSGRYKFNYKLRLSNRIYQSVLGSDILDVNSKVVVSKGSIIQKEHISLIKELHQTGKLSLSQDIELVTTVPFKNKGYDPVGKIEKVKLQLDDNDTSNVIEVIGVEPSSNAPTLTIADFLSSISYLTNLTHGIGSFDDIDHLGNKRIKLIHELLKTQAAVGLGKIEKFVKEKLAIFDGVNKSIQMLEDSKKNLSVKSVVNTKPFQQSFKEFFNSHQLTQFLDQENPLSELTNKRRISAMGPGGISRDDPNLDIRDVHYSHYGRLCPVETPEGMNIGLIMSLATYARIDEKGFIVTPYRTVKNKKILSDSDIVWLSALQEEEYVIAEANSEIDENNYLSGSKCIARYRSSTGLVDTEKVDFIDVSPKQVISLATAAIPFLENDDGARALMGANMQRQAVPLIKPSSPFVGTGIEYRIAKDSGLAITSSIDGEITYVDSSKIIVSNKKNNVEFNLNKFKKSNQETCINQVPIVHIGQKISSNEIIADGPAMQNGELALGQNALVAFSTWSGYNYEDAIILSERLFKEDVYTSIHITEHIVKCVKTKVGDEEITRELPNVSEDSKKYLDEDGIVMVGAKVKEGDILVGKITPRGQVELSSEERLLQAIFGEKTRNVKESSLRVSNGGEGIVSEVKRFTINDSDELDDDVIELIKVYIVQKRKIQIGDKMSGRHGNKGVISKVVPVEDMPHLEDGTPVDIVLNPQGVPSRMNIGQVLEIHLGYAAREKGRKLLLEMIKDDKKPEQISSTFGFSFQKSLDIKNKISELIKDNKNIDIKDIPVIKIESALKSLGVSLSEIGIKFSTPVFDGIRKDDLEDIMKDAGIDPIKTQGKFKLIDGRTGESFDNNVAVGIMYFLKLGHMVDDKIHARSIGPYSKITQQPLGGKSQNGGQRFGEMEVWALEAYGASHTLREILTIKSDDVRGRNLTYSSIIKGKEIPEPSIPESFKLLTKELQGLGLTVNLIDNSGKVQDIGGVTNSNIYEDEEIVLPEDALEFDILDEPVDEQY
jgi:DNA-directed RNA polymerase subunit beta